MRCSKHWDLPFCSNSNAGEGREPCAFGGRGNLAFEWIGYLAFQGVGYLAFGLREHLACGEIGHLAFGVGEQQLASEGWERSTFGIS